tara:strand:+ start:13155 stop:14510 length:1356 start_codon:yes stop_codon:yes gene_type:complete
MKIKHLALSALVSMTILASGNGFAAEQVTVDKEEYEQLKAAVKFLMSEREDNQKAVQEAKQAAEDAAASAKVATDNAEEATEVAEAAAEAIDDQAGVNRWFEKTQIGGYGEVLYNNGTQNSDNSDNISNELDVQRFIFYISHQFTDNLRFFSETELEHSRAGRSDDDPGAVELEQAYIEWDYSKNHSMLAGLYLPPVGIINETHEPETFYGVERPRVESRIIPTTYRVTGVKLHGQFSDGFSYDIGIHEGLQFDDGDLDIRDSRQSGAQANADALAGTGRIKYTGMPGLELAASLQYQSDMVQDGISNNNLRRASIDADGSVDGILSSAHAIYENGPFGLRALYSRWDIDDAIEDLDDGAGRDEMEGWYIEPSWRFANNLGVFARYTMIDERAGSNDGDAEDSEEKRFLLGMNYWLHPNVVFKADVQFEDDDDRDSDNDLDGFNLGVGWSF